MKPRASGLAACVMALLASGAAPSLAGWSAEPVEVHATMNDCPQVAACEDGTNGAFIAWEESDGPLRVAHLLPTGDLDPLWPAFVVLSTMGTGRAALRALPDGTGGAYFAWIVGESLFVQRVTESGAIPAPWPARGRSIRKMLFYNGYRPSVIPDGAGGLYVGWLQLRGVIVGESYLQLPTCFVDRRGPDGLVSAGWPAAGRAIGVDPLVFEWTASCGIALAPDGGTWVAWANTILFDPGGSGFTQLPGTVRLLRLAPTGQPTPGWTAEGIALASFPADSIPPADRWGAWSMAKAAQIAVSTDGGEGAYVVRGVGLLSDLSRVASIPRLFHVGASGATVPGWPEAGLSIETGFWYAFNDDGADASLGLQGGSRGDVYVAHPSVYYTDTPPMHFFTHVEANQQQSLAFAASRTGWETSRGGDGGFVLAEFHPCGPYQRADDLAHVACHRSNGPPFLELHTENVITWYGDIGVTGLRDGGAILCWSQNRDRHGIYAVRLNAAGLVTDAPPASSPRAPHLALRFEPGAGIRASASFAGAGETRLLLADVTGRAVARETFEAAEGGREWTLAGTAALAPGLYFARVTRGAETLTARVVVTR